MGARTEEPTDLPNYFDTVAHDVIDYCGSSGGRVWGDLGSGPGGLGLALLERISEGTMVLMDPIHRLPHMPLALDFGLLAAFCTVLFALSLRNIRRKWIT